ncbi:MAG: cation:proton antiporter subunit C [Rhodospirillaceae bacterium]
METIGNVFPYWFAVLLFCIGLYVVISRHNLIKKIVGLTVFQAAVFLLYISFSYVEGGTAPILGEGYELYANPLPSVLILTAIVVGISGTAMGLALTIRIREEYGTIEEDELIEMDRKTR